MEQRSAHHTNNNGFLVGLILGMLLTLLFTTKKGREILKELVDKLIDQAGRLENAVEEKFEEANTFLEEEEVEGNDYVAPVLVAPVVSPVVEPAPLVTKKEDVKQEEKGVVQEPIMPVPPVVEQPIQEVQEIVTEEPKKSPAPRKFFKFKKRS